MALDNDYLESLAQQPAEVVGDAGSIKEHSLPDVIAALDRVTAQDALSGSNDNGGPKSGWGRLRMARAIPKG